MLLFSLCRGTFVEELVSKENEPDTARSLFHLQFSCSLYLAGPIFAGPEIANQICQTAKTAIEKMQDSVDSKPPSLLKLIKLLKASAALRDSTCRRHQYVTFCKDLFSTEVGGLGLVVSSLFHK
jgi:hypothetical protein